MVHFNLDYRRNLVLYWRQFYPNWIIPKGYHVHHIKPKSTYADKSDPRINHPRNLIALHPDDHVSIHKLRGDKFVTKSFVSIANAKCSEDHKRNLSRALTDVPKTAMAKMNMKIAKHIIQSNGLSSAQNAAMKSAATMHNNGGHQKRFSKQMKTKAAIEWKDKHSKICKYCSSGPYYLSNYNMYHGENCLNHSDTNKAAINKEQRSLLKIGENNPEFAGYYHTPWGKYASRPLAINASAVNLCKDRLSDLCKNPNKIISQMAATRTKVLSNHQVGLTHREAGFWFESKGAF